MMQITEPPNLTLEASLAVIKPLGVETTTNSEVNKRFKALKDLYLEKRSKALLLLIVGDQTLFKSKAPLIRRNENKI